ncbi:MAG: sensor domain-containing diguanylate cyclase [Spongiibacteraceae bacterium]
MPNDTLARSRYERLARTVSELMDKATQNERILRKFQQYELQLLAVSGMEALFDCLLGDSLNHFQLDAVELWLFDPDRQMRTLLPATAPQWPGLVWLDSDRHLRDLYTGQHQVHLVNPLPAGVFIGRSMRSAALLPLVRHGALVGALHLGALAPQRFTADKSTDFIEHLACIVASCIENSANHERLHRLSMIDMLTRVENRRAFTQSMTTEIARAARHGEPLTVMLADLDHFKRVNDNHGHQIGDRVLSAVAQEIVTMLRKTDHVCRYGGEEFALILPNCDRALAQEVAERIRVRVSSLHIASDSGIEVPVTLSLGLTCWSQPGAYPANLADQLIGLADKALYRAKDCGRNRVEFQAMP